MAPSESRLHPAWWTAILAVVLASACAFTAAMFAGSFRSDVPVTVYTDRAGLLMEPGAKVKLRGIEVGQVIGITGGQQPGLHLAIFPDQLQYIPANVGAEIRATTVFGAKFVDLVVPNEPSAQRLSAGAVLTSINTTTEVNTVFENLMGVLKHVDPPKVNAILTALADAVRGKGDQLGQATTDAAQVVSALNAHRDALGQDFRSTARFSDTYGAAAHDILATLDAASTTSTTVTSQARELDTLLLNSIGFATTGTDLIGPNRENLVDAITLAKPTTDLVRKYNPEYTCLIQGAKWFGDHATAAGSNGYSTLIDATIGFATDMYRYPDNLPKVGAKGGPGGQPGCGSLPEVAKRYPVRALVTDTGWGTGLDYRPNPGIAHPWWVDFFPTTRAVPQPPTIRGAGPPAIGPVPYPGAPPYGAPLFGSDGQPLWAPPPPGAPPPPVPGALTAPPPYGPAPDRPNP